MVTFGPGVIFFISLTLSRNNISRNNISRNNISFFREIISWGRSGIPGVACWTSDNWIVVSMFRH